MARIVASLFLTLIFYGSCCCHSATGECKNLDSCEKCIMGEESMNITECIWVKCEEENDRCDSKGEAKEGCTIYNETKMCSAPPTTITTKEASTSDSKEPTPAPPTEAPPVYKPSSFDPASFVGGIVLVLGAQAVSYFVLKFVKSKDSTYETLEEAQ
ncbi:CD164 sialomucin-like 2 protein isoform X1 [Protopterus annectens]|uniref:CD164 sialomucin-like 2 protein isoform X1 n=1 Tax=Protopterus annectens TaxID=7888 RepID=UPI001CFC0AD6|nr:CD164 sialomucin-like 2 protein isoform X1 [Protopterus annectens]